MLCPSVPVCPAHPYALGRLLDRPGVAGRNSDTPDVLGRNIAISQRRGGRFSPENAASVRMSPENENESPEHGSHRSSPENENETPEPGIHEPNALKHSYDEQRVKWGESSSHENEYDSLVHGSAEACQMGNQRMEYRIWGHIGDRPLTKGPPPKRRALCERFATAYAAREV